MSTLRGPLTRSTVHTEFFPLAAHPSLTLSFRELVLWAFQLIVSAVSLQLICLQGKSILLEVSSAVILDSTS